MASELGLVEPPDDGAGATLVDTNVILDLATDDPKWEDWSFEVIASARDHGRVVINPTVYAEVSVGYDTVEAVDEVLPPGDFEREDLPFAAAFLAGKAYLAYRRRGGNKRSPLADLYIGAHAATRSYRLLTRNAARYRTYFPTVDLVLPDG